MIKLNKTTLLTTLIFPGLALAQVNVGDALGTSELDIRSALEAQGYVIAEFEIEDDEIEVEATLDSVAYEIEVSPEDGTVLEIEMDDEDESDESDDD